MNNKIIGYRISSAMLLRGKQQKDLASALGVKPPIISYYCGGSRTPDLEKLVAISEYLGVSCDYLLGIVDYPTRDEDMGKMCEYTGLSEEAIQELHVMNHVGPDLGGDQNILYALDVLLKAQRASHTGGLNLGATGWTALVDIARFLERKERLDLTPEVYNTLLKCYKGDPFQLERIVNGSLETEILNEIGKSLNAIREQYYLNGSGNDGKH